MDPSSAIPAYAHLEFAEPPVWPNHAVRLRNFRGWLFPGSFGTSSRNSLHSPVANHIRVERERLCSPLRDLKNLKPAMLKQLGRCTLSVEGGSLSIVTPVLSIHLPATGEWDEDISVKLTDLVAAESAIAQIPTVSIAVEGNSLLIGGVEVAFETAP